MIADDTARLYIADLPANFTDEGLATLLRPFSRVIHSKINRSVGGSSQPSTACVEFDDAAGASEAFKSLNGNAVEGNAIVCRLEKAHQASEGVLRASTVQLTWGAPRCSAFARYPSTIEAAEKAEQLSGSHLRGTVINASLALPKTGRYRYTSFTVLLKDLPLDVTSSELELLTETGAITVSRTYQEEEALNAIGNMMHDIGPVVATRLVPRQGHTLRMVVTFRDPSAAAAAALRYHNTRQAAIGNGTLYAQLIASVRLYLSPQKLAVLASELNEIQQNLKAANNGGKHGGTRLTTESNGGKATITLFGNDVKDLGPLKQKVQRLIAGEPVLDRSGSALWDTFLETPKGLGYLNQVARETASFVFRDTRRQIISVSGSAQAIAAATDRILARIGERRFLGPIDPHTWRRLLKGPLNKLQAEIGKDAAVPDFSKRVLLIRGSEEVFRVAETFVERVAESARSTVAADSEEACPICFCEPTNFVATTCGHKYCSACIRDYLMSARSTKSFPILCVDETKDNVRCNVPFSLTIFRQALTTEQDRLLLEAALSAYIQHHPKDFRYCPTPDCEWVYRPQPKGTVLLCDTCLQRICASCHTLAHEGLSCDEYAEGHTVDGKAFLAYKQANNIKSCPKCRADIFKDGGCNHVTCAGCKTHICWVCMEAFQEGNEVYDHMNQRHGGIGI